MALTINLDQQKMFVQGDFDMNSLHSYPDSLKEAFKQTMLNQEFIFRKQVNDLHRLYRVQITLMKEVGCKEFDRYSLWNASTESSLIPYTNPIGYEPPLKDTRFSSIQVVGSTPLVSQELLEEWQYYKLQWPFDLQVPSNQCIRHADKDFLDKGNVLNHSENTLGSHVNNVSDAMDLTLSLSLGADSRRREGAKRSWLDEKTHSCPQDVIDLEDTTEKISSEAVKQVPSLCRTGLISFGGRKHESQVFKLSDSTIPKSVKKDLCHKTAASSSLVDDGECYQEWHYSNKVPLRCSSSEFVESQDDVPCMSTKRQQKLNLNNERHLDLNKVQVDDLPGYSNDPIEDYRSTSSSSGVLAEMVGRDMERFCPTTTWRKETNNCSFSENSDMLQHDGTVRLAIMNSHGDLKRSENWHSSSKTSGTGETEASPVGVKSISRLPMDLSEHHGNCCSGPKSNIDKSTSELHGGLLNYVNHKFVATSQVSCEKSEVEDAVYSCSGQSEDKQGNKCAASCKSCCIVDNELSSIKTMQSGIESGNSSIPATDQFSGIHVRPQVAKVLSGEHRCNNKKEESTEVDILIQRAAESLINISLETSVCLQDCSTGAGSSERENGESEQPQNSSGSYELIALKLTESSSDDYSVSSKPFELNGMDTRDFSIKLRRGRRMKDFQKEILPGLASLSRHEILEDINILEGVLRSKEYRKNRARLADGETWSPPLRSRRTRFNYNRRRNLL